MSLYYAIDVADVATNYSSQANEAFDGYLDLVLRQGVESSGGQPVLKLIHTPRLFKQLDLEAEVVVVVVVVVATPLALAAAAESIRRSGSSRGMGSSGGRSGSSSGGSDCG